MYSVSDLRKGLKIEMDGVPFEVVDFQFVKPGKGQAMYKCRLKSMLAGNTMDKTFRAVDKIDQPNIEEKELVYSYAEGDEFIFIDHQTYEQFHVHANVVGDQRYFLEEGLAVNVLYHNDRAVQLNLPSFVEKKIAETEPGARGDTATNVLKPAKLDNGFEIGVPLFINAGDVIKIDTRTGKYFERVARG
ncbi:MAG: elongation factor P [Lentisphaerota bacterium]